jgi:hypothetical protein
MKQRTQTTLRTLSDQVVENRSYAEKLGSILLNEEQNSGEDPQRYLPVICSSSESNLHQDEYIDNVYTVQSAAFLNTAAIVSEINHVQEQLTWVPALPGDKEGLRKDLLSLIEKETLDERTSNEILRMFDADNWLVLKGSGK